MTTTTPSCKFFFSKHCRLPKNERHCDVQIINIHVSEQGIMTFKGEECPNHLHFVFLHNCEGTMGNALFWSGLTKVRDDRNYCLTWKSSRGREFTIERGCSLACSGLLLFIIGQTQSQITTYNTQEVLSEEK